MMSMYLVKGMVSALQITRGRGNFVLSEVGRGAGSLAALGALSLGEAFSASVLDAGSRTTEPELEFFSCSVGDDEIIGEFDTVGFADGEIVEFVINVRLTQKLALAARSERRRLIWVLPHHARGHTAQRKHDWRWSLSVAAGLVTVAALGAPFVLGSGRERALVYQIIFFGLIFLATLGINLFVRAQFSRYAQNATRVFAALGLVNPENIDLELIHAANTKAIRQKTGARPPSVGLWTYRY